MNQDRNSPFSFGLIAAPAMLSAGLGSAATHGPMHSIFEQSRDSKQGLTVVSGGRDIALIVTEICGDYLIGRSQQHDRIVVRIDRIEAVLK